MVKPNDLAGAHVASKICGRSDKYMLNRSGLKTLPCCRPTFELMGEEISPQGKSTIESPSPLAKKVVFDVFFGDKWHAVAYGV